MKLYYTAFRISMKLTIYLRLNAYFGGYNEKGKYYRNYCGCKQ